MPINVMVEGNKKLQEQQEKKKSEIQTQAEGEPRAITMAKALKEKREQVAQDKDKADEEEAVIEELENQGDLKEDVPIGGEEFEAEELRQGS